MKRTNVEMLSDFLEGLNIAIGGVDQMVHARLNPKFMGIRDLLNIIRDKATKMVKEGIK